MMLLYSYSPHSRSLSLCIQSIWLKRSRTSYPISSRFLSIFPFSLRLSFSAHALSHTQHTPTAFAIPLSLSDIFTLNQIISLLNKGPGCWISYAAARSMHLYVLHAIHHTQCSQPLLSLSHHGRVCVCRKWNVILIWGNINLAERRFVYAQLVEKW